MLGLSARPVVEKRIGLNPFVPLSPSGIGCGNWGWGLPWLSSSWTLTRVALLPGLAGSAGGTASRISPAT